MNAKLLVCLAAIFLGGIGLATPARAQTNTAYERGLLEEEVHHELTAAIRNYQDALSYLVTNRLMLADALFRMAECYRKQGMLTEARIQYRRIVRDFPDQTDYTRLSQEIIGAATNAAPVYVLSFGNDSTNAADNLAFPGGVAVDPAGNVYVSDTKHDRIQKFNPRGGFLLRWGGTGKKPGCLAYPQGLAADANGFIYVADVHNHRVQKFTSEGTYVAEWGGLGSGPGRFNSPYAVAVDQAGKIYVADARNDRIQKFTPDGEFISAFGQSGVSAGQLHLPKSVAVDRAGNLYVCDVGNRRIQKLSGDGRYLDHWGSYGKGPGQFDVPHDVAVDPWGNIYVADADGPDHNNRVQLFYNDGNLATIWGQFGDGPGEFNFVSRVAVDPTGLYIYVCDASNNRVQLFTYANQ